MKRLAAALSVLALLLAGGCEIVRDGTPPSRSPEPLPPPVGEVTFVPTDVPANTIPVRTEVHLYDDEGVEVPGEFLGIFELEVHYPPREGRPVPNQATLVNMQTGEPATSPHRWEDFLPLDATQRMESAPIFIRLTGTATLGPWWQLVCVVSLQGMPISMDKVENEGALPVERTVNCIY